MKIFAIDQSLKSTGWAAYNTGKVESGTRSFQEQNKPCAARHFLAFSLWLRESLKLQQPNLVVFEESAVMRMNSRSTLTTLIGLRTLIMVECEAVGIECLAVNNMTLKKFATGNGKAEKPQMQARAKEEFRYYIPEEDPGADEADALMLLLYGIKRPDLELQVEKPKPRRRAKAK